MTVAPSSLAWAMICARRALLIAKPATGSSSCRPTPRTLQRPAVEQQAPAGHGDRADPARQPVAEHALLAGADGEAGRVQVGTGRRPQPGPGDAQACFEARKPARADAARAEVQRHAAVAAGDLHGCRAVAVVAHDDAREHGCRARRAGQVGAHDDVRDVDAVDALQVDLAQQPAVVPPAAGGVARAGQAGRREVGAQAPVVDPDDEPVRAGPLQRAVRDAQVPRQVGAGVATDRPAVEPDARSVVDRLEAHEPVQARASVGQAEVLAIPRDRSGHRRHGRVADVPGVGHGQRRPAVTARLALEGLAQPLARVVAAKQPLAAEQVAVVGAVLVDRAARDAVGRGEGRGRGRDGARRRECEHEQQGSEQAKGAHSFVGAQHRRRSRVVAAPV